MQTYRVFKFSTINYHKLIMYHDEFSKNSYEKMLNVFFYFICNVEKLVKMSNKLIFIQRIIEHLKLNKIFNFDLLNFF